MDTSAASLPQLVRWAVSTHADLPAVRDGATALTYTELGAEIDRAARALVVSGVEPGDAVAVWAPNCWQWVVVALATARAGGRLVPVNTRFKGEEAAYVLDRAGVVMVFVVDGFLDTDYSGSLPLADLASVCEVVDLGDGPGAVTSFERFMARGDGGADGSGRESGDNGDASADERTLAEMQAEVERRSDAVGPDDIAAVMFTSGTTGRPKGVLVRGGAIIRAFAGWGETLGARPGDPYLLVNPYFHAFGFNSGIVVCLMFGALNLPVDVYDPDRVLATIERERVALFPGPPAVFQGLLNHPDLGRYDLSSLRACVTGAATIPVEMVVAMRERLGFKNVVTAYGMTETSGIAAYTRQGDPPNLVAATSGRAIPDVELRVVDETGHEVDRGREGELLVRGFQVTPGYLDDPEATAKAIDGDGWLHTGDIAVMDDNGYIDITDRKKDMFIVGGFNAYPAEIERVMMEHPEVGMAAVVGVPDDRLGEVGAAFVVPASGRALRPEPLIEWCRERMANYKVPRHVWPVASLPLTASNKVRKPDLRAQATVLLCDAPR